MRRPTRAIRALLTLAFAATAFLVAAPAAMAGDGAGLLGRPDDKMVTFFGLGVVAFFTVLVIVLSAVQARLDQRKDRRRQQLSRNQ